LIVPIVGLVRRSRERKYKSYLFTGKNPVERWRTLNFLISPQEKILWRDGGFNFHGKKSYGEMAEFEYEFE